MQRKTLLFPALVLSCALVFSGCHTTTPGETSAGTTSSTTSTTTLPVEILTTTTVSDTLSSEETLADPTYPPTAAIRDPAGPRSGEIDEAVFEGLGLTFDELKAKYGPDLEVYREYVSFDRAPGRYAFEDFDSTTHTYYGKCTAILCKAERLFLNFGSAKAPEDIWRLYDGLTIESMGIGPEDTWRRFPRYDERDDRPYEEGNVFVATFRYHNYTFRDPSLQQYIVQLDFDVDEDYRVRPDTYVRLSLVLAGP